MLAGMRMFRTCCAGVLALWMVLSPAFSLAGVVLCVGPDGHIALEPAHEGRCHDSHTTPVHETPTLTQGETDCCGDCVDVSLSSDNGNLVNFTWEMDDGVYYSENVSRSFPAHGYHSITLTVRDDEGLEAYYTDRIYVQDIPAEIRAGDQTGITGSTVRLTWTASDQDGDISKYIVTFPDGKRKETNRQYLDHIFNEPGTYVLNVTVVDDMGLTNSTTFTVEITGDASSDNFIPIPLLAAVPAMVAAMRIVWCRRAFTRVRDQARWPVRRK